MGYPTDDDVRDAHERREPPSAIDDQAERLARAEALTPPHGITPLAALHDREHAEAQRRLDEQDDRMARAARGEPFYRVATDANGKPVQLTGLSFASPEIREHLASIDPTTAAIAEQVEQREQMSRELATYRGENARIREKVLARMTNGDPVNATTEALVSFLCSRFDDARKDLADLESTFEIIKASDGRAIAMFKEAHPDSRVTFPDRANMLVWILEQLDTATREADALRQHNAHHDASATPRDNDLQLIEKLRRENAALRSKVEADIKAPMRHGKDEIETLQRRVDELMRQRDAAEGRFQEANHNHGETSAALSAMTIKWLNLENASKRAVVEVFDKIRAVSAEMAAAKAEIAELKLRPGYRAGDLATARIRNRMFEGSVDAVWSALERIPREICHFSERGPMDVETAVEMAINALLESRGKWMSNCEELREQLRVADADRVPLAQDLEVEREAHRAAREKAERMEPVVAEARALVMARDLGSAFQFANVDDLRIAVKAYEATLTQAANEGADPDQIDMPF